MKIRNSGIVNGTEYTNINMNLHTANSIDKIRITYQHTHTEACHIIRLTQGVQFDCHFVGSRNLQDAHRAEIAKIDLGIGHIVDNDQVMALRKCYSLLKKTTVGTGSGRIVRVVQPQETRPGQHILRNTIQVWKIAILLQEGEQVWLRANRPASGDINGIIRIRNKRNIPWIEDGCSCICQSLFRAKQRQYVAFRQQANTKTPLEPCRDGLVQRTHTPVLWIACNFW